MTQVTMQMGKNGLTDGFLEALKNTFELHEQVKISILKSAEHNRQEIREMAESIITELGKRYTYRIVGFTIFIRKWRNLPPSKRKR